MGFVEAILFGIVIGLWGHEIRKYIKENHPDGVVPADFQKKWRKFKKDLERVFKMHFGEDIKNELDEAAKTGKTKGKSALDAKALQRDIERVFRKTFPEVYAENKTSIGKELKVIQKIAANPAKAKTFKSQAKAASRMKKIA